MLPVAGEVLYWGVRSPTHPTHRPVASSVHSGHSPDNADSDLNTILSFLHILYYELSIFSYNFVFLFFWHGYIDPWYNYVFNWMYSPASFRAALVLTRAAQNDENGKSFSQWLHYMNGGASTRQRGSLSCFPIENGPYGRVFHRDTDKKVTNKKTKGKRIRMAKFLAKFYRHSRDSPYAVSLLRKNETKCQKSWILISPSFVGRKLAIRYIQHQILKKGSYGNDDFHSFTIQHIQEKYVYFVTFAANLVSNNRIPYNIN